ncbi:hypothetical protein H072_176 [Dactylellina haptotyla CBS 200.50]|uniref:F-box domain-containing protein n=1 Tax=Dactylellina haptotyla (strain CBS 200.50) TaxID=1284197 RepID=S8ASN6_DACHA|nr:hypothetical protein H072_176 [Dactylellina haptotyla CBS 200.50]
MATPDLFDKVPYLNALPLETSFPYLTPDTRSQASRTTTLACTRIAILGSLKANRLQGVHRPGTDSASPFQRRFALKKTPYSNGPAPAAAPPPLDPAESSLIHLLTNNYITQKILLQHLSTYDLIALRQTSSALRRTLDRERPLWRTVNLSSPRRITPPSCPHKCPTPDPTALFPYFSKIANNHLPNSPISPYHHIRVMILDNYRFKYSCRNHIADMLYLIFSNQCLWENLKLLSIRGFWELEITNVISYLRDWEIGIRGDFRKDLGWRFVDTITADSGEDSESFQVLDRNGQIVPRETWWAKRGWALEVLRFAGPGLFADGKFLNSNHGNHIPPPRWRVTADIPVNVPNYLCVPQDKSEDTTDSGESRVFFNRYEETLIPLPVDASGVGGMTMKAVKLAKKIGINIDVGFCKNTTAHANIDAVRAAASRFWVICEKRWEVCVLPDCKWAGWTESCGNCRWREGQCCKGCYGWVCEGCRKLKRNDFGEKGVWCGGAVKSCTVMEGGLEGKAE